MSSHSISLPFKREALSIESVILKFLVDSLISKDTAVKLAGRTTSGVVSPTGIITWSPVGRTSHRRAVPLTSNVKKRGSDGFTPPVVHASREKLATAVASVSK